MLAFGKQASAPAALKSTITRLCFALASTLVHSLQVSYNSALTRQDREG